MECSNCLGDTETVGIISAGEVFCSVGCLDDWEIAQAGEKAKPTLEDAYDEPTAEKTDTGPCVSCPNCKVNLLLYSGEGVHGDLGKYCSEECLQTNPIERMADRNKPVEDVGSHYRKTWKGLNLDPYRIADIYGFTGGPREHLLKKVLRGVDKGHTERELVNELKAIVKRWEEMLDEGE